MEKITGIELSKVTHMLNFTFISTVRQDGFLLVITWIECNKRLNITNAINLESETHLFTS